MLKKYVLRSSLFFAIFSATLRVPSHGRGQQKGLMSWFSGIFSTEKRLRENQADMRIRGLATITEFAIAYVLSWAMQGTLINYIEEGFDMLNIYIGEDRLRRLIEMICILGLGTTDIIKHLFSLETVDAEGKPAKKGSLAIRTIIKWPLFWIDWIGLLGKEDSRFLHDKAINTYVVYQAKQR